MSDLTDAPFTVAENAPALRARPMPEATDAPFAERVPFSGGAVRQHFESQARGAKSFKDYLSAGWQQSILGLGLREQAPEVAVDQETPWYGRAVSGAVGLAGDIPAMIAGGVTAQVLTAGRGGPVATGAGAFALPMALRAVMMDAYTKGEVKTSSEFMDRSMHAAWEGFKGAATGAATVMTGGVARALLPAGASIATKAVVPTAAEVLTMVTTSRAMEGQLPEPSDFLDAAIMLGGLKAAGVTATRLRSVYAETGVRPEQVVAEAMRNPEIKAELTASEGPGVPKAYLPLATEQKALAIVPGEKAAQVAASPFALEIPQAVGEPAKPSHVNYDLINTAEDTKLAMARLSQVYEGEIQTQRRGTVSWDQTSAEAAKALSDALGGVDIKLIMPREPGTPAGAAELLARKQMTVGAAESMMAARDNLLAKGSSVTMEEKLQFVASIERAAMIQADFLGARAEAGRALNILKSTAVEAERVRQIQQVVDIYGNGDPVKLAEMMKQLDNPASALKFARDAVKATTWERVIEAWKAGLVSGPVTHMANLIGNSTFAVLRVPIDAVASAIGAVRGGADRVSAVEPIARIFGGLQGTADGLRIAGGILKTGETPGASKAEQFRPAIEGTVGEVVRLPFRALSAEDAVFRSMAERAEANTLAVRAAVQEGLNPLTREFRERVVQLTQNPTPKMQAEITAAGERFTFNSALGEKGKAVQEFVRQWHLEWAVPFIRTPGNIFKELARMTPLAPLVKEWREAFAKGGASRDKAIAEVAVGTAMMSTIFVHAIEGNVTGQGPSDQGKRRTWLAAGNQPYSVKIGDSWYNYQRIQPIGTLVGMAADVAEVWDHLTEEESDKVPKMLSVAFANAVTSQTFLQGITNVVNALSDPKRFGAKLVQQYAGSVVPAIVAQPTAMLDPVTREVYSVVDAVKARLPGLRETLYPKRDVFGEPVQAKERLGAVSPVTETKVSEDKVRSEASRLGISAADAPKKIHLGKFSGKMGDVELTPEERDRFAQTGGQLAYSILATVVNDPTWDALPDLVKRRTYQRVFTQAHKVAAQQSLPIDKRLALLEQITEKVTNELAGGE